MNNKVSYREAVKNGFKIFEADVRLTTDKKPVCVNGWLEDTYKKMNLDPEKYTSEGMDAKTFFKQKYYDGHYEVLDFDVLVSMLEADDFSRLYIDIGKPSKKIIDAMMSGFAKSMSEEFRKKVTMRVGAFSDIPFVRKYMPDIDISYTVPEKEAREKMDLSLSKMLDFLAKYELKEVSFNLKPGMWEDEAIRYLRINNYRLVLFACNTYSQIVKAGEMGFEIVGTHFCTVNEADVLL